MNDYQLVVIGAGPGGYEAALHAAGLGLKTAVVEKQDIGGTCLNRGCVPTKTLLHSSEVYAAALEGAAIGVCTDDIHINVAAMFANKDRIVTQLRAGIEGLLKKAKVDVLRGLGTVMKPGLVQIAAPDGAVSQISCDNILIASGSVPAHPPIPGLDSEGVLTSDEILEWSGELFDSIVIIGGGVIGVEFATFYAELGIKVTIVEGLDRLLPTLDRDLGQNLSLILKGKGVDIYTKSMVKSVEATDGGMVVNFESAGKVGSVSGEVVLCAVGRSAYSEGLFAPELQPARRGRALAVDEHFATSLEGVYAIGDVSSPIQLAHVASAQGCACVEYLAGVTSTCDLSVVPSCVYCRPEIASVGLSEADAKEAGISYKVGKAVMGGNARTLISGVGRSFMKIIAEAPSGRIIGAHLMCPCASDMLSQLSEAIANKMSAEQLLCAMRPHPTFEEALGDALRDLTAKLARAK